MSRALKVRRLVVGPLKTNCYIADCGEGECIVVDPGADPELIVEEASRSRLNAKLILITHGHPDHYSAYLEVKNRLNAEVGIHPADVETSKTFGTPVKPDLKLEDGMKLKVGSRELKIIHTPGHSPGSISILGENCVFTGDTLFKRGYGRTDLPGGSYKQLVESVKKILTLEETLTVYPGHGPQTSIAEEKIFYKTLGF